MTTSMAPSSVYEVQPVETLETPVVLTTTFIRQHSGMKTHDIMYQVLKQLVDIVKLIVEN